MAGTVIDSLVVTLGLDSKGFLRGQQDARKELQHTSTTASRTSQEMQASGKRAAESFASIKTEVLGLVGALLGVGGVSMLVKKTTNDLANLGREARNIGMAAPELAAFRNMIERNGGSADAATQSFRHLTDEMERFKVFGQSSIVQFLTPIGAQRGDSAMEVYQKFVRFAQAHKNDAPLINLVGRGLGLDQGSINEAMKGTAQVQKDLEESYKLGVPTNEQIKRATELQHDWIALQQAAENLANVVITNLEPALHKILTSATHLIEKNPQLAEALTGIAAGLTTLAALRISARLMGLGSVVDAITAIESGLGRIMPWLAVLGLSGDTPQDASNATPSDNWRSYLKSHYQEEGPAGDWFRYNAPSWLGGVPGIAAPMDETQQRFLQVLSDPESGGDYTIREGGSHFSNFSHFPEGVGAGGTTTASGRYQFTAETWGEAKRALGLPDFSPASQDRAAWWLADREYRMRTGRDLESDIRAGGHEAEIAAALNGRWTSLPGGSQERETAEQFKRRLAPVEASPAAPPMNPWAPGYKSPAELVPSPLLPAPSARQPPPTPPPAASGQAPPPTAPNGGPNQTSLTVGSVTIHSRATDVAGIARDFHTALTNQLVTQADRGLA